MKNFHYKIGIQFGKMVKLKKIFQTGVALGRVENQLGINEEGKDGKTLKSEIVKDTKHTQGGSSKKRDTRGKFKKEKEDETHATI